MFPMFPRMNADLGPSSASAAAAADRPARPRRDEAAAPETAAAANITCQLCQKKYSSAPNFRVHLTLDHYTERLMITVNLSASHDASGGGGGGGAKYSCMSCGYQPPAKFPDRYKLNDILIHYGCVEGLARRYYHDDVGDDDEAAAAADAGKPEQMYLDNATERAMRECYANVDENQKNIDALKLKLLKANELKLSEDYLDEKTYKQLNTQLEIMEMEEKLKKGKAVKDELDKIDAELSDVISNESYKTVSRQHEMSNNITRKKSDVLKMENDLKKMQNDLKEMESNLQKAREAQDRAQKIVEKRKRSQESDDFIDAENLTELSQSIDSKKRRLNASDACDAKSFRVDKSDMECIVCLEVPRGDVSSCLDCDNIICHACLPRIADHCPTCRAELSQKPLRRNRAIERILQKMK